VFLLGAGTYLLFHLSTDFGHLAERVIRSIDIDPRQHFPHRTVTRLHHLHPHELRIAGIAAKPATVNVSKTGSYAFKITNNGKITHSFEVEGNGVAKKTGNIEPGESETLTVDLTKGGTYDIFCPIDGHKARGMKGSLTVGAGS
jgi:uncharacterized cupredoxin-like copper-binding protein